jgi:hypothetical protein
MIRQMMENGTEKDDISGTGHSSSISSRVA